MSSLIIDEIKGSGPISITQKGITASRIARCRWDDWPQVVSDLMGVLIVFGNNAMIIGTQTYPGLPALLVDSVEISGMGKMLNSSWGWGPRYDYAKLDIAYKVPEFQDDKDENGQPATYLIESLDYSVEIATVPVKVPDVVNKKKVEEDAGDALERAYAAQVANSQNPPPGATPPEPANDDKEKKTKIVKRHIRIPTITYTVTIPKSRILPADQIRLNVGKVNKSSIFGGPRGTVLFDGPNAERESAFLGDRTWRIKYQFIYQPHGWNNMLNPETLKWVPCIAVGADNAPYEFADLKKIFPSPYTVRS